VAGVVTDRGRELSTARTPASAASSRGVRLPAGSSGSSSPRRSTGRSWSSAGRVLTTPSATRPAGRGAEASRTRRRPSGGGARRALGGRVPEAGPRSSRRRAPGQRPAAPRLRLPPHYPTMFERFGLRSLACRLSDVQGIGAPGGMRCGTGAGLRRCAGALREEWDRYDFFFLHFKETDSRVRTATSPPRCAPPRRSTPPCRSAGPAAGRPGRHRGPLDAAVLKGTPGTRCGGVLSRYARPTPSGLSTRPPSPARPGADARVHLMGILLACGLRLKKYGA